MVSSNTFSLGVFLAVQVTAFGIITDRSKIRKVVVESVKDDGKRRVISFSYETSHCSDRSSSQMIIVKDDLGRPIISPDSAQWLVRNQGPNPPDGIVLFLGFPTLMATAPLWLTIRSFQLCREALKGMANRSIITYRALAKQLDQETRSMLHAALQNSFAAPST